MPPQRAVAYAVEDGGALSGAPQREQKRAPAALHAPHCVQYGPAAGCGRGAGAGVGGTGVGGTGVGGMGHAASARRAGGGVIGPGIIGPAATTGRGVAPESSPRKTPRRR